MNEDACIYQALPVPQRVALFGEEERRLRMGTLELGVPVDWIMKSWCRVDRRSRWRVEVQPCPKFRSAGLDHHPLQKWNSYIGDISGESIQSKLSRSGRSVVSCLR